MNKSSIADTALELAFFIISGIISSELTLTQRSPMSRNNWEEDPPPTKPQLVTDELRQPVKKSRVAGALRWLGKAWMKRIENLGALRLWD
jgi:hypothetical protein